MAVQKARCLVTTTYDQIYVLEDADSYIHLSLVIYRQSDVD